nr:MAG TPA: hypothetical protein [Caudoviricetes sp.]
MKNWLIEKLGGVSKEHHSALENKYSVLRHAHVRVYEQKQEAYKEADSYLIKIERLEAEKAEKAEMEEAGKAMSERISELIDELNEERKVSNGLMAKGTALGIKVSELQDELERKNKELSQTKVKLLDVLRKKPTDPALRSEIARLKGELELLKRNKFKRGRK